MPFQKVGRWVKKPLNESYVAGVKKHYERTEFCRILKNFGPYIDSVQQFNNAVIAKCRITRYFLLIVNYAGLWEQRKRYYIIYWNWKTWKFIFIVFLLLFSFFSLSFFFSLPLPFFSHFSLFSSSSSVSLFHHYPSDFLVNFIPRELTLKMYHGMYT